MGPVLSKLEVITRENQKPISLINLDAKVFSKISTRTPESSWSATREAATMRSHTPKPEKRPRSSQLEKALHQQRPSTTKNKHII